MGISVSNKKDISNRADFSIIRYANCWEDTELLIQSLNINNNSDCFSVASAGDNSLALLTQTPKSVVAFDINPTQLACVELKHTCFKELNYQETIGFLGFDNAICNRKETYNKIKHHLTDNAKTFWDNNIPILENGIIYAGKFEKYFDIFANRVLPLVHRRSTVLELLQSKPLEKREAFYHHTWDNIRWKGMFKIFFSRFVMGYLGRDPEFFKYVEGNVSKKILNRTEYAFTQLPTHDNSYLNAIMTGDYTRVLPYYVQEENFCLIKNNADRLTLFKGNTIEALKTVNHKFDCFNLSDIFEYMDPATFKENTDALLTHANSGARFAYWNMLVERRMSSICPEKLHYLEDLSNTLFKKDKAFFYKSFYVEERV